MKKNNKNKHQMMSPEMFRKSKSIYNLFESLEYNIENETQPFEYSQEFFVKRMYEMTVDVDLIEIYEIYGIAYRAYYFLPYFYLPLYEIIKKYPQHIWSIVLLDSYDDEIYDSIILFLTSMNITLDNTAIMFLMKRNINLLIKLIVNSQYTHCTHSKYDHEKIYTICYDFLNKGIVSYDDFINFITLTRYRMSEKKLVETADNIYNYFSRNFIGDIFHVCELNERVFYYDPDEIMYHGFNSYYLKTEMYCVIDSVPETHIEVVPIFFPNKTSKLKPLLCFCFKSMLKLNSNKLSKIFKYLALLDLDGAREISRNI